MVSDPDEAARRVRAARAYARLTRDQLAARCGLTAGQIKLLEDGRRRVTTRDELIAIGDACGVPSEFMDRGFDGVRGMYEPLSRLFSALLSQQIEEVLRVGREFGLEPSDAILELHGDLLQPPPTAAIDAQPDVDVVIARQQSALQVKSGPGRGKTARAARAATAREKARSG